MWVNAAILAAILAVLIGRGDGSIGLTRSAFAQAQPVGGGGLFLMPAQISQNVWGCYVMDIDQQTICGYAMTGSPPELKLVAARNFRFDRQLGALNTTPPPSEVRVMLEKEKARERVTESNQQKPASPENPPQSD